MPVVREGEASAVPNVAAAEKVVAPELDVVPSDIKFVAQASDVVSPASSARPIRAGRPRPIQRKLPRRFGMTRTGSVLSQFDRMPPPSRQGDAHFCRVAARGDSGCANFFPSDRILTAGARASVAGPQIHRRHAALGSRADATASRAGAAASRVRPLDCPVLTPGVHHLFWTKCPTLSG
jgi:hypothetical protein